MNWIAVEQGKSLLRAWAMQDDTVLDRIDNNPNTSLARSLDEQALLQLVGPWLDQHKVTVLACGPIGSDALSVPAKPGNIQPVPLPTTDPRLRAFGLPGLVQPTPLDVLHSDTARIAGFLTLNPGWDGVICQPGAQTSWAHVSAGEVVSFQNFLTGDLAATLSRQLNLPQKELQSGDEGDVFTDALETAMARPERMASALNLLRVEYEMGKLPGPKAQARLWGILIGCEMAAARPYWLGQQLAVIAPPDIAQPYQFALQHQGTPVTVANSERMTLAGLTAARKRMDQTV